MDQVSIIREKTITQTLVVRFSFCQTAMGLGKSRFTYDLESRDSDLLWGLIRPIARNEELGQLIRVEQGCVPKETKMNTHFSYATNFE